MRARLIATPTLAGAADRSGAGAYDSCMRTGWVSPVFCGPGIAASLSVSSQAVAAEAPSLSFSAPNDNASARASGWASSSCPDLALI